MKKLNADNRLPLYHQLYDIIVEKIEDETYKENDKLPSEREFCDKYDISRATVRRAMVELEKNDYILFVILCKKINRFLCINSHSLAICIFHKMLQTFRH